MLTDSKPCVQAYEKSGATILPSDFASRNAAPCEDKSCQICIFRRQTQDSVIRQASIQDIMSDDARLPFTSHTAWLSIQAECPDLRRTHAHLQQGTRPSKKLTNIRDFKTYLAVATIAKDCLLVVLPAVNASS